MQRAEGRIVSTSMFTRCPQYVIVRIVVKYYVLHGDYVADNLRNGFPPRAKRILRVRGLSSALDEGRTLSFISREYRISPFFLR